MANRIFDQDELDLRKTKSFNKKVFSVILSFVALSLIAAGTYAAFNFDVLFGGTEEHKLSSCKLSLNLKDDVPITLVDAVPISDEKAKEYDSYKFTVTNKGNCDKAYYKISLGDVCKSCTQTNGVCNVNGQSLNCTNDYKLNSNKVKYEIINKKTNETFKDVNPTKLELIGEIAKEEAIHFELRLWIDSSATKEDLYVYENGKPKENSDGSIVTKNAAYQLNVEGQDNDQFVSPLTGAESLIEKVGTGGLVAESHPGAAQLGATTDYRYTGVNPDNYIKFNDEIWRIIGVFDVDDGSAGDGQGKIEKRIKIIKLFLGNSSWSDSGADWSKAQVMKLFNEGDYYNRSGDYALNGLTDEAKSQIADAKWYLGEIQNYDTLMAALVNHIYNYERGENVYTGNPIYWVGKVGLMYGSDYGYATEGGSTTSREACLAKALNTWNETSGNDCKKNNWLFNNADVDSINQWTISSYFDEYYNNPMMIISSGMYSYEYSFSSYQVSPVVYLKADINLTGEGTSASPYEIVS